MSFRRRDDFRLAINTAGGTERNVFDAVGAHGLQHVERGHGVLLEILVRMLEAKAHIRVGRQMKNEIATGHRTGHCQQFETVAFHEFEPRIGHRCLKKFPLAGGKIVPANNVLAAGEQPVHEVAADESGRAGHEDGVHLWGYSVATIARHCQQLLPHKFPPMQRHVSLQRTEK